MDTLFLPEKRNNGVTLIVFMNLDQLDSRMNGSHILIESLIFNGF